MHNKTALVTGASGGIGYEFARVLARNGYNLVLTARNEKSLHEAAERFAGEHGVTVLVIPCDLAEDTAPRFLFDEIQKKNMTIDVLINNAGFGDFGPFHTTQWDKTHAMIEVNIKALTELTRLFLPDMVTRKHGRIVNVASTAAFQAGPLMSVYYATKAYVLSFSEAIAYELKDTGVTITALCPGPTESGFLAAANLKSSGLFKGKKLPSSREVAEYGYEAMIKGKVVAVHGILNRFASFLVQLAPRALATRIVYQIQKSR
jgi:short-subunit dehydrogenase